MSDLNKKLQSMVAKFGPKKYNLPKLTAPSQKSAPPKLPGGKMPGMKTGDMMKKMKDFGRTPKT